MTRMVKKRSKKTGLPPGTLVHVGEKRIEKATITVIDFDKDRYEERRAETVAECLAYKDTPTVTWINVDAIHEVDLIEQFGTHFGLHPLVLEDLLNTDQRPKVEDYDDYVFIVLKMLSMNHATDTVEAEQVCLVLGPKYVLTFQEKPGDVFEIIRDRLRTAKGRVRKMPADYLVYALIDAIVDHYFGVLERIGEQIELLEQELFEDPTVEKLHKIHVLKRELIFMRRAVWPLREVIMCLERGDVSQFRKPTTVFLRDLYDHTVQIIDTLETFREMTIGMLDIYLSAVSNRMNAVMKVLTIIATLFIPLTFVAGVYGMNFKYMPELEWPWGYPAILLFMFTAAVLMLMWFRRKRWL